MPQNLHLHPVIQSLCLLVLQVMIMLTNLSHVLNAKTVCMCAISQNTTTSLTNWWRFLRTRDKSSKSKSNMKKTVPWSGSSKNKTLSGSSTQKSPSSTGALSHTVSTKRILSLPSSSKREKMRRQANSKSLCKCKWNKLKNVLRRFWLIRSELCCFFWNILTQVTVIVIFCRASQLAFPVWVALDDWAEEQFVQAVVRGDKRGWEGDGERVWLDYWLFSMRYVWVGQTAIHKLFSQGNSSVYNTRDMGPSASLKWPPSPQSSRLSRRYWEPQLKKHSNLMINWWTL